MKGRRSFKGFGVYQKKHHAKVYILIMLTLFFLFSPITTPKATCYSNSRLLIAEVYPNGLTKGDLEEYVAIFNPTRHPVDVEGWSLTDGEGEIVFPKVIIQPKGTIYVTRSASVFKEKITPIRGIFPDFEYGYDSDATVRNMQGRAILLRNEGDEVILKDARGRVVDVVIYGDSRYAKEGWGGDAVRKPREGWIIKRRGDIDTDTKGDWLILPLQMRYFAPEKFSFRSNRSITAFVSPDSSFEVLQSEIKNAKTSLYLNFYEFENYYVMDSVIEAMDRGVRVYLLLQSRPIGGISPEEAYIAAMIKKRGGDVRLSHVIFNHAKYVIIDNETVIIMSENCGITGFPPDNSFGNRGWGVVIRNRGVASYLRDVFLADFQIAEKLLPMEGWAFEKGGMEIPSGTYKPVFEAFTLLNNSIVTVTPVLAPDNALMEILDIINSASRSVYVEMFSAQRFWDKGDNPFVEALIDAARRGCEVKVLLDSNDYNLEDWNGNDEVVSYLREVARRENLSLEARLADLDGLVKIHNKGLIVDGEKVLISSLNWNANSIYNREVGVIVENKEVAAYYTKVFFHDWNMSSKQEEAERGAEGGKRKIVYVILTVIITFAIFIVLRWYRTYF
ncbi:MAG: phospholipase D-like domain-containing protein [Candidatus Methanospirareceae archaeon]